MSETREQRAHLLALHVERGCTCSDRALAELVEMVRIGDQHESVAAVAMAEVDRLEADLAASRAALAAAEGVLERFADLGQLVLDRITNGATNDERYLMKDTARLAMEEYRALALGTGGRGEGS